MAFLNPLFLIGLFAAGIPLLIHLWSRRQAVTVDFSSLMFLVAAHRQNVRRLQLKQLLILLLRMLIIALLALALARPFLTLGLPLAAVRAKTDVVIILDNSYSMNYEDVDGVWFDKAKTLAVDVLSSLRHGDSASVILMSDIPQPVFRQLTPDIESVIAEIQKAELSFRTTIVQPSVEIAHEILTDSTQQNKEIYIISDYSQNGWTNTGIIPNRSGSRIVLLPVNTGSRHNTNIEEILTSHQLIGVDLPLHLRVNVKNHSDTVIDQTTLTLYVGEQKKNTRTFSIEAGESIMTTVSQILSTPGIHTGYFALTDDRLNTDNRRYFSFESLGEIRVLCVSEQSDYLLLALNPLARDETSVAQAKTSMIQPVACSPTEFETYPLDDFDVILLVDIPMLSAESRTQLREFIRQGKDIIVFASESDSLLWLPVEFGEPITWQIPEQVSKIEETHPIFEIFSENVFSGQYGPRFFKAMTVTPSADATVIARYGDNTPFLIERSEGNSHILLFNTGLQQQPHGNELLVNPFFLPLIQHSVLYVMHSKTQKNITVGDTYFASFPQNSGGRAWIKRVDSVNENNMVAVSIADDGTMRFDSTELPGLYQVDVKTKDRLIRDFFAVNTATAEADLTHTPLEQASKLVDAQAEIITENGNLDTDALDVKRHGREIWGELLVLVVCLLLLEGYLSNRASTSNARET